MDEFSKYMLPKKTVAQFTEKNPNPNYKNELAEYSHVDEHTKYMIQKPTVAQFQKEVISANAHRTPCRFQMIRMVFLFHNRCQTTIE